MTQTAKGYSDHRWATYKQISEMGGQVLPEREQFATANGYYQTALHELGHATGHPARMDRDTLKNGVGHFGSVAQAVVKRGGGAGRTSVSQSWKVTGHFFRLHLRPRCPGSGHNQRIL